MGRVWEFAVLLLLIGALVLLIGPRFMGRRGPGADCGAAAPCWSPASARGPTQTGQQFVTITGVINGPTVNEHVVYQRMAVDVNTWPTMGQLYPVVYSAKNPDNWSFAPPA